jgi:hypothetical protein
MTLALDRLRIMLGSVTLLAAPAAANAHSTQAFEFETPIPPGIAAPDEVQTRLGTLRFHDGFPNAVTAAKVYDNLDFHRGLDAYLTSLPAVSIEAFRQNVAGLGPVNETVLISEQLLFAVTFPNRQYHDALFGSVSRHDQWLVRRRSSSRGPRADG